MDGPNGITTSVNATIEAPVRFVAVPNSADAQLLLLQCSLMAHDDDVGISANRSLHRIAARVMQGDHNVTCAEVLGGFIRLAELRDQIQGAYRRVGSV